MNESAGAVEVCLLKEGVTAQNITVSVIAQELAAGNSASGRCVFTISVKLLLVLLVALYNETGQCSSCTSCVLDRPQ